MNIKDGVRWNTANAYLRTTNSDKLDVKMGCVVNRIIFDGKKAIGVEFI